MISNLSADAEAIVHAPQHAGAQQVANDSYTFSTTKFKSSEKTNNDGSRALRRKKKTEKKTETEHNGCRELVGPPAMGDGIFLVVRHPRMCMYVTVVYMYLSFLSLAG